MKKVSIELAEWLPRPSHAETHDRRDRGPTAFGSVRDELTFDFSSVFHSTTAHPFT